MAIQQMMRYLPSNLVVLLAGGLLPLSFAPFHYYPVAIISLVLLFVCWSSVTAKRAAILGFLFGLGFFGVGVSWIYVAIHDFGQSGIFLASLLTTLFAGFLSLYLAGLGWLIRRFSSEHFSTADYLLLLPAAWLIFEWFKGWFLTGFPWLELGVGQIDGPLSGYTPVIGVLGVSLLTVLSAGLLTLAVTKKRAWPIVLFILIWSSGQLLKSQEWTQAVDQPIKATIIQGNVPQQLKWDRDQLFKTLALYQARTEEHWDSDLIIWPENAITVFYHQAKDFFLEPLTQLAIENDTEILIGMPVLNEEKDEYYNSMVLLGKQEGFYYKRHLVPFGEYIPFEWLRGLIAFFDLPMSSFRPGPAPEQLMKVADQSIGISICYEDVFSTEVMASLPEARLLVNASNNAWYGDSFAPQQHLQIAQNRALEMGRPTLRATTNGISALIDYKGRLTEQTAQFKQDVITVEVQPREGATPYVKWGQRPLWILSLFMLLVWGYHRRDSFINSQVN